MHESTIREIIDGVFGLGATLAKEEMVHKKQRERLELQQDHELELAKIRHEGEDATGQDTTEAVQASVGEQSVTATPAEIEAAIDDLIAEEKCATCKDLLRGLKERPTPEQIRGIMEYGTFKDRLSANADVEELKALINDTEVLQAVMHEDLMGARREA